MKNLLFIDLDSTLNTLDEEWCNYVNERYDTNISSKDILHWNWMTDTYGEEACDFWKDPLTYSNDKVKPKEGSIDFVNKMNRDFEIVIITSSWPGLEQIKSEYIHRHFGIYNVIHSSDKWGYTRYGILVDDRPSTVFDHCCYNRKFGIIFDHKGEYGWSKLTEINCNGKSQGSGDFKIATSFKEIEKLVREYYEST